MDTGKAIYKGQAEVKPKPVFFTGSTAILKGQGLCYVRDQGTATDDEGKRDNYVAVASTTNNSRFAGYAAMAYNAKTGGQDIIINEPGCACQVLTAVATVVNSTYLTCQATSGISGWMADGGLLGRGTALALQTTPTASTTSDPGPLASSLDGTATVSADGLTVTKTSGFTNAVAGDKLIIAAGATTTTSVAGITPGVYTIASKTSSSIVVLSTSCSSVAASISYYLVRGSPTVLAYTFDGRESGLVEWITPLSTVTTTHPMVGGATLIFGGNTITTDGGGTLADGAFIGQQKFLKLMGTLGTNDYILTVTTGVCANPAGASATAFYQVLATAEFDAVADTFIAEWAGTAWVCDVFNFTVASNPAIA